MPRREEEILQIIISNTNRKLYYQKCDFQLKGRIFFDTVKLWNESIQCHRKFIEKSL